MKKSFTLGAIAGMSALALAIPVLAQVSSAASTGTTTSSTASTMPSAPKQWSVQDMITQDQKFLANIDAMITVQKSAVQAHETALTAAAALTDAAAQKTAVQKANQDERAAIEAAIKGNADLKSAMRPFGGRGPGFEGRGGMMKHGFDPAALATKLGMTPDELKSAIEGGQKIEDIAKAKGITLPERPVFKGFMKHEAKTGNTTQQ